MFLNTVAPPCCQLCGPSIADSLAPLHSARHECPATHRPPAHPPVLVPSPLLRRPLTPSVSGFCLKLTGHLLAANQAVTSSPQPLGCYSRDVSCPLLLSVLFFQPGMASVPLKELKPQWPQFLHTAVRMSSFGFFQSVVLFFCAKKNILYRNHTDAPCMLYIFVRRLFLLSPCWSQRCSSEMLTVKQVSRTLLIFQN